MRQRYKKIPLIILFLLAVETLKSSVKILKEEKISTFFGGANIDLRDATIAKYGTATLDVSALFGGVKLVVPKEWKVVGNLSGFFGGFSNKTTAPEEPEGTLILKGSGTFGGGEVTN